MVRFMLTILRTWVSYVVCYSEFWKYFLGSIADSMEYRIWDQTFVEMG